MEKTTYFIAALYQRLYDKDPSIPYLNVRIIILMNIIFHLVQLDVWIKNGLHKDLFANTGSLLFFFLLLIAIILFLISTMMFPKDTLESIEVKEQDKFICYWIAMGYFFLDFAFLMYLLFHYLPT